MTGPFDDLPEMSGPEFSGDEALAADYALGVLDGATMRNVELRMRRDFGFARMVEQWRESLSPLNDIVTPVVPRFSVWTRIEQAIAPTPVIAAATPTRSLWASLSLWRALTAAATAVAAVALALLVSRPAVTTPEAAPVQTASATAAPAVPGTLLTAAMSATGKPAVLLNATFDPVRGAVILTPASANRSRGKTPEMWLIIGKDAPRSLGVIDLQGPLAHPVPEKLRPLMAQGATLAISLEPAGGSPTGAPTGPVIMTGKLAAI